VILPGKLAEFFTVGLEGALHGVIPAPLIFIIRIPPRRAAFPGAPIRLPPLATLARMNAAEFTTIIVRIVRFPFVISGQMVSHGSGFCRLASSPRHLSQTRLG
jgi:hypothetical protein